MNLAIVGSRSIREREALYAALTYCPWIGSHYRPRHIDMTVITGDAKGVDTLAKEWAGERGFRVRAIEPDWDDWSRGHPALRRNTTIVNESDKVLAIWDGKSTGTRDTIDKTLDQGKEIYVHRV